MDLRKLWSILPTRRRRRLMLVMAVALVAAAADGAVVLLVEPLIDALQTGSGSDSGDDSATSRLAFFAVALAAKNVVVIAMAWFKNRELFAIQSDVSEHLLAIYIRGTNPAIRELDAGQRTSFAITEPLQLVLNCYLPLVTIVAEVLSLVAVSAALLYQRPSETLALIVLLGIGLRLFTMLTRSRIIGAGRRRKDSDTRRTELVRSLIESRVEVSGLGVADDVLGRYAVPNRESAEMTARKAFLTEVSRNVLELLVLASVGPFAVLYLAADRSGLVAMLAMFGLAAYRALPALNRVMVSTQSAKFGAATVETIHGIISAEPPDRPSIEPVRQAGCARGLELELRFDGFELRNGRPILDGLTIRLAPGDTCVVWGPSGSGKSSLLEALVDGAEGVEIRYGGRLLANGLSELRGLVGVTAQSPLVLPATLRDNLSLGAPPGSLDLVAAASMLDEDPRSILDADSISEQLDRTLHRHSVSGGQAQRISLIRALARSHEIVLLDEPTSALDGRVAAALRQRIAGELQDRIFLIVTHDPELKDLADIVVEIA